MKKILLLGAGMVSRPFVHYMTAREDVELTVASILRHEAEAVLAGCPRGRALELDARSDEALGRQIAAHDLVVSLLPATEHLRVARLCLDHGKQMTNCSYISPEMRALAPAVAAKGLTFVHECGLDPGIDHMSAMRVIDATRDAGGRVVGFRSYCGGLPAPEANTNPLGYKFSWAPRGVLMAATNDARFLRRCEVVEIPGRDLFAAPELVDVPGAGRFEGYPNRDSLSYIETYGLAGVETMFRGTLRNVGHCETFYQWARLGLLGREERDDLGRLDRAGFVRLLTGGIGGPMRAAVARRLDLPADHPAIDKLAWLGLFDDGPLPVERGATLDVLAALMLAKCAYEPGERDMVVLQHEFEIEIQGHREVRLSTLVDYGVPHGDSSMARTVALPLAIATRLVLDGRFAVPGIHAPTSRELYDPILDELATLGISCRESSR